MSEFNSPLGEQNENSQPQENKDTNDGRENAGASGTGQSGPVDDGYQADTAGQMPQNYYRDLNTSGQTGWSASSSQNTRSGQNTYYTAGSGSNEWQPPQGAEGSGQYGQNHYQKDQQYKWSFEDYDKLGQEGKAKRKKNRGFFVFGALLAAVVVVGLSVFIGYQLGGNNIVAGPDNSSSQTSSVDENLPGLTLNDSPTGENVSSSADGSLTITQIAEKALPSIVGVVQYQGFQSYQPAGEGSGIVMTEDGYIITNAHVIEGATSIKVVLQDGNTYEAQVVGSDSRTDLAVIKIDATGLTPAEFGNSDNLKIGEEVIAIGNPGGLAFAGSVTDGIVSALNREVSTENGLMTCIQTNAAINPGNSGGALLNRYGQVIGINSSKISATGYEGMGFAIPITDAQPIINDLIQNGRVTGRVRLGITGYDVDEFSARYSGVPTGVFIYTIEENSTLAQSGVVAGDIITQADGQALSSMDELREILEQHKPGDQMTFTIYRRTSQNGQGREIDVTITLQEDTGTAE